MRKQVLNTLIICAGVLGLATTAQADTTTTTTKNYSLTANADVTSNYVFRGETQTDDSPAIQGGIDFNHNSGFYAGAWGSNVKFPNAGGSTLEYDLYAGFKFPVNDQVNMDVGYITYNYMDSTVNDNVGANEVFVGAAWKGLTGYYYHGSAKNSYNDYQYFDVRYAMGLPNDFKLTLHYGHKVNDNYRNNDDASVRIGKNFYGYDTSLTLTTISHDGGPNNGSKSRLFITVTKYFNL
ncbi:MAG: TorF family putative porin [Gammaproteobacteria bacterium]